MRIVLTPDEVNLYMQKILAAEGLECEGSIEWTWNENEGPAASMDIRSRKSEESLEIVPMKSPVSRRKTIIPISQTASNIPSMPGMVDMPMGATEAATDVPVSKKKVGRPRGSNKQPAAAVEKQVGQAKIPVGSTSDGIVNVTERMRKYHADIESADNVRIHPVTGKVIKTEQSNGSTKFPG